MDHGVSQSEQAAVMNVKKRPTTSTGDRIRRLGTPAARMPTISPSLDMRLRVIRMPTSAPVGSAKVMVSGSSRPNREAMVEGVAELRTSSSKLLPARWRKSTKVKSTVPRKAFEKSSRRMARLRRPIFHCTRPGVGGGTIGCFSRLLTRAVRCWRWWRSLDTDTQDTTSCLQDPEAAADEGFGQARFEFQPYPERPRRCAGPTDLPGQPDVRGTGPGARGRTAGCTPGDGGSLSGPGRGTQAGRADRILPARWGLRCARPHGAADVPWRR